MKEKTFMTILRDLARSPLKGKRHLKDPHLTLTEKKIIEANLIIRDNQNEKVLECFRNHPSSDLPFIESQKNLIMGIACNNLSRYQEAESHIETALDFMRGLHLPHFQFIAYFNLFLTYYNMDHLDGMQSTLQALKGIPVDEKLKEIRLLRCQFLYYSELNEISQATEYLNLIKLHRKEMHESDSISHLVCEFMFHIRNDEFTRAEKTLAEMKRFRKFQLSENYNFMKKLLNHLMHDAPIYSYSQDFKNVPLLHHQLNVIQALEANHLPKAREHWDELRALSPAIYQEDFQYFGKKNLFSLCLKKHESKWITHSPLIIPEAVTKIELLIEILRKSETPLTKEKLYEIAWGKPPQDKEDLRKLTRMISRIRGKHGIEVETRKGTYLLKTTNKTKSA